MLETEYSSVFIAVIVIIMAWWIPRSGFINVVKSHPAKKPAVFIPKGRGRFSLPELIDDKVGEFKNNAITVFNPFLFTGHLQTMWAGVRSFRFVDKLYFGRLIIEMPDGGSASLDRVISYDLFRKVVPTADDIPKGQPDQINSTTRYLTNDEVETGSDDNQAILVALHGLSGSSAEAYCRCLLRRLSDKGFDCYVLNSRGCGNTALTSPKLFCGLATDDIRQVVKRLKAKFPNSRLYCVGFSLGSVILSNYLAQEGANSVVDFATTLACIWDLRTSSYKLENGFISSNLYSPIMTYPLKMLLASHKDELEESPVFKEIYTPANLKSTYSLRSFDDHFTSKMFGFTCAEDYYTQGSPFRRIYDIQTPLLNINSEDDPIAGSSHEGAVPLSQAKYNPYLTLLTTNLGGHLGWFKWNDERWYAEPLSELFVELHDRIKDGYQVEASECPKTPLVNGQL